MAEEEKTGIHPADTNGDGIVDDREHEMYLEFKRKEMEDADAAKELLEEVMKEGSEEQKQEAASIFEKIV